MTSMTSRVGSGTRGGLAPDQAHRRHLRVVAEVPAPRGPFERLVQVLLAPGPGDAPLRLTRRGRVVLRGLVVLAAVLVTALAGLGLARPALAADGSAPPPAVHVVQPGETLWHVAGVVAPQADRRDTVLQLIALNGLPSSGVVPGQELVVPSE